MTDTTTNMLIVWNDFNVIFFKLIHLSLKVFTLLKAIDKIFFWIGSKLSKQRKDARTMLLYLFAKCPRSTLLDYFSLDIPRISSRYSNIFYVALCTFQPANIKSFMSFETINDWSWYLLPIDLACLLFHICPGQVLISVNFKLPLYTNIWNINQRNFLWTHIVRNLIQLIVNEWCDLAIHSWFITPKKIECIPNIKEPSKFQALY